MHQLSNGPISSASQTLNANASGLRPPLLLVNNVLIPMALPHAWVILVDHSPSNKVAKMYSSEMFHGDTQNAQPRVIQQSILETPSQQFILGSRQMLVSNPFSLNCNKINCTMVFLLFNCTENIQKYYYIGNPWYWTFRALTLSTLWL